MKRNLLAPILFALTLAGCTGAEIQDPVYEIPEDEFLVVMPFKDPDFPDRWDSNPRGHDAARLTTEVLQREADFGVRPYEDVLGLYLAEDVTKLSPRDVAALCKADYVLLCDFERLELRDPKNINMIQGTARVKARLFQVQRRTREEEEKERRRAEEQRQAREAAGMAPLDYDRGGRFIAKAEAVVEARFPSDFMHPGGDIFLDPDQVQEGLLRAVARKVAKLYYPHPKEKIETD
ncbi:MAG: hypothetical protein M9894_17360 [Planctomycetes bacterium]|nr:hypothetical protein [Planctomycetota bacterium]